MADVEPRTVIVYRKDGGDWQGQTDPGPLDGWEAVEVTAETWRKVEELQEASRRRLESYELTQSEEAEARDRLRQEITERTRVEDEPTRTR